MTARLRVVEPSHVIRSVPVRPANSELRPREYLTPAEVEKLLKAARTGRYAHRDATLILIAYRHGLRAIEACDLEWSQVEFGRAARCMSDAPRTASHRRIRCEATRSGRSGSYADKSQIAPSCSLRNAAGRSRRMPSIAL